MVAFLHVPPITDPGAPPPVPPDEFAVPAGCLPPPPPPEKYFKGPLGPGVPTAGLISVPTPSPPGPPVGLELPGSAFVPTAPAPPPPPAPKPGPVVEPVPPLFPCAGVVEGVLPDGVLVA